MPVLHPPGCHMDVTSVPPSSLESEDVTSVPPSSLESDSFVFSEKNSHPNKMLEGLNRLRLNNTLCDVVLCCGGTELPCHRNVLASFSAYFEAMFTTGMLESRQEKVDMVNVEPQAMELLVSYAYTSELVISTQNVQALLAASNLLGLTALLEVCCHYMSRHMDEKNCVGIHFFAEAHSCTRLEKHSMDYILEHFSVVYQQEEFQSLPVDKLTEILACDKLNVNKEETVFDAAMLWLNKCPSHRQSFEKVLPHIRLGLISPSYLHHVMESLDVVKESQACQRMISEAREAPPRWSTVILMVDFNIKSVNRKYCVETFDPQSKRSRTLAYPPFAVQDPSLVVSGSTVYLAGGWLPDYTPSKEMWCYDSSCDSWLKMAPMNEGRGNCGLLMLDGCVYAVGGRSNSCVFAVGARSNKRDAPLVRSVERYDLYSNTWQLMESDQMPDIFASSSVVALDGLIYVIGRNQIMYHFNPKTSAWTQAAVMLLHRSFSVACALKGKIYVIGGAVHSHTVTETGGPVYSDQVECYDPKTDQWSMCSSMNKRRLQPGVTVVHGQIYVIGGSEGKNRTHLRCVERYCDQTDSWEVVGEMETGRLVFSCVSVRMPPE